MPIKSRKEREKEQRRKDIIDAAESLFFKKGYDNVSMNDIAKEVELSKATIYLYFENKEELFFAIVLRGTRILNAMIREAAAAAENGIDKVAAFRVAYHKFTKDYPDYIHIYNYFQSGRFDMENIVNREYAEELSKDVRLYSIVHNTDFQLLPPVSEYAREIMSLRKERFDIMRDSLKIGIIDGTVRPDVDPVEVSILLSAISKSMSEVPPDHIRILESRGINSEKYFMDVENLLRHMIMNK
ncbi:TetR/AcrR family transcriptional regulator [Methanobacterium sp. MBAC-LM]|uniref:TetR/AcrR family transcriptional regulator n=1 Tax=Methanobacterium sp. MBAC-LM TaxID=3412034 RepID=UPI003C73C37B